MKSFVHFGSGLVLLACAGLACGDDTTGTGGSGATGGNGGEPSTGGNPSTGGSPSNGGGGAGQGGTPATGGGGAGQGGMTQGGGGAGGAMPEEGCFFYPDCDPNLSDTCQCLGCGNGNECTDQTDCVCPACVSNEFCQADDCVDDGECDPYLEGCVCADCADQSICN